MNDHDLAVADVLDKAAENIEIYGWCQGMIESADGRLCLVGAIRRAAGQDLNEFDFDWAKHTVARDACEIVKRHINENRRGVYQIFPAEFNDYPRRTEHDVIDVLRRAAKTVRNGE